MDLEWVMPYVCAITGKKTTFGKKRAWAGQKIQKGGFGLKPTGISRRTFKPNLQKVAVMVDGRQVRMLVCAKSIRNGDVVKPLKRKYGYTRQQKAGAA